MTLEKEIVAKGLTAPRITPAHRVRGTRKLLNIKPQSTLASLGVNSVMSMRLRSPLSAPIAKHLRKLGKRCA